MDKQDGQDLTEGGFSNPPYKWNDGVWKVFSAEWWGAFCGTPLGFGHMGDRQPSVRYATLGSGV